MQPVSTTSRRPSTVSSSALPANDARGYCLRMVDIKSCGSFKAFLERLIEDERWTRAKIAQSMGVGRQQVLNYLSGDKPKRERLERFAELNPEYALNDLVVCANGIRAQDSRKEEFNTLTHRGAQIGRIAESIESERIQLAILELVSSLERDTRRRTGTK